MKYRNNVLLQFCNVWWLGGTSLFVLDVVKAFPDMHHIICYRHDQKVNYELTDIATGDFLAEVYHMPTVTRKFLDDKQPFVTIAHNLPYSAYEKDNISETEIKENFYNQFSITREYPIITWHHSAVREWLPTAAHIFNSKYTAKMYENLNNKMPIRKIIPPCIDVTAYASVRHKKDIFNFGMVDNWNTSKFSMELFLRTIAEIEKHNRFLGKDDVPWHLHIVTSRKELKELRTPSLHVYDFEKDLHNFYGLTDCLIYYPEIKDTWGRVVTEAMASGCSIIYRDFGGITEQMVGLPNYVYPANGYSEILWLMNKACKDRCAEGFNHNVLTRHADDIAGLGVLQTRLLPLMMKIGNGDW